MKKVYDLDGTELALWVARALGWKVEREEDGQLWVTLFAQDGGGEGLIGSVETGAAPFDNFSPQEDWSQCGPIIDREKISLTAWKIGDWTAEKGGIHSGGKTALIAAMRVYVASNFGSEVNE